MASYVEVILPLFLGKYNLSIGSLQLHGGWLMQYLMSLYLKTFPSSLVISSELTALKDLAEPC